MTEQVRIFQWRNGREVTPPEDIAAALADASTVVWVALVDADARTLEELSTRVGLDPRSVEDSLTPGERPKATRQDGHTFMTCHASSLDDAAADGRLHDSRLVLHQISAFVLPHGLLTVHHDAAPVVEEMLERLRERPNLVGGSAGLAYALLDVVVDGHFDTIQSIDDVAEDVEDQLFADARPAGRQLQEGLYRLHKELVHLRRAVLPLREVVGTLRREFGESGPLAAEFDDLYDRVMRVSEWTESLRDMVGAMFETNVSLLDARLNVVMKKLAGWAAVIAVPTAITGWFGQNVPFPGQGTWTGLAMSVGLILVGTTAVYGLLRRHDWI